MFSKKKRNHLWFLVCNRLNLSAQHSCSSGNQRDMKLRRLLLLNSHSSVPTPPGPVHLHLKMTTRAQQDRKWSLARVGLNASMSADKGHEYN